MDADADTACAVALDADSLFSVLSLPLNAGGLGALVSRRTNVAMMAAMCHPNSAVLANNSQFKDECRRLGIDPASYKVAWHVPCAMAMWQVSGVPCDASDMDPLLQ